eukprot:TRINITY_DN18679_c0_g1_i1.p2 TRINITY_DN18679_c0_g1~~TRINITY_DN18679_c0_g1_i1.p2  ORF type:complete len:238 (-),score=43.75 TRINITY_DN18679_c0_g1_i1:494-1207(-)
MAAVVDNRNGTTVISYPNNVVASPLPLTNQTVVQDTYGGWMTRGNRALVFGLFGLAWVIGAFLPGIIMIGMNWSESPTGGIRGACTNEVVVRALTTCCFFIFHGLLVCPMFVAGDRAHSVTTYNSRGSALSSFWTTHLAHTAAVLQVVGNLIQIALLIWTAVTFWGDGIGSGSNACGNTYPEFRTYMWAMLIIGFFTSTLSLVTVHKQYTSAALRVAPGTVAAGGYAKAGPALVSAP